MWSMSFESNKNVQVVGYPYYKRYKQKIKYSRNLSYKNNANIFQLYCNKSISILIIYLINFFFIILFR